MTQNKHKPRWLKGLILTIMSLVALGLNSWVAPIVELPSAQAAYIGHECFWLPTKAVQKEIQQQLKNMGYYTGVVDGVWGSLSVKAIQTAAKNYGGYTGPIDGVPGINTCLGVQRLAQKYGGYTGPIDGYPGANTWNGFLQGLTKIQTPKPQAPPCHDPEFDQSFDPYSGTKIWIITNKCSTTLTWRVTCWGEFKQNGITKKETYVYYQSYTLGPNQFATLMKVPRVSLDIDEYNVGCKVD